MLKQYPEYGLRYPGATLTGEGGGDGENGPLFYTRASAGAVMGSNDSKEQILAFYERELAASGWQRSNTDTAVSTADLDAYAWRKGSAIFRLAFLRKTDPRNPAVGEQYATPFSFTLIADDPRDPSWTKQPYFGVADTRNASRGIDSDLCATSALAKLFVVQHHTSPVPQIRLCLLLYSPPGTLMRCPVGSSACTISN